MDDDFERRMELRRQRREQMRLETESMTYGAPSEDEEEAARERRRRAREERMRSKEHEDPNSPGSEVINTNSVTETESSPVATVIPSTGGGEEEESVLLERLAKREERRQKRLRDAMDRQRELDPAPVANGNGTDAEERRSHRDAEKEEEEQEEQLTNASETNSWRREEEEEEEEKEEEVEEQSPKEEEQAPGTEEPKETEEEEEEKREEEKQVVDEKPKKLSFREKQQNGGLHDDGPAAQQHKTPERSVGFGRGGGGLRGGPAPKDLEDRERQEAERKLEDLKRRRDNADSEEFEKMKMKQQEAEADLETLKRRREERRKVVEEEEAQRKQEMEDKKAREQEERRKMKEEIERRRAEAAEKKKQMQEEGTVDGRPAFTCVTPKGCSKIGERAEFLNKSSQKSAVRASHTPIVSKIGNRLEQYATAVQGNKEPKSPRSPVGDLPVGGTRNMKNMWEKGNVLGASENPTSTNKDAAGIKVGVAGRVNDWLAKPPETGKAAAGAPPADLKPGDVTNKRGLWETKKSSTPAKVTVGSKNKSVTNAGLGH